MTGAEFKAIRAALGLTQVQLAAVLGFNQRSYLAAFEGSTKSSREIPPLVERLMIAYRDGYRPKGWPV